MKESNVAIVGESDSINDINAPEMIPISTLDNICKSADDKNIEDSLPRHCTATQVSTAFTLNVEQQKIFDYLIACYQYDTTIDQRRVYCGGGGGTGKSRVITALKVWLKKHDRSDELVVLAYTGQAAKLVGGRTIHSVLALVFNNATESIKRRLSPRYKEMILKARLLIFDEISFISKQLLSNIHTKLNAVLGLHGNDVLFGGKHVCFMGDFYQLSPVKGHALHMPINTISDRQIILSSGEMATLPVSLSSRQVEEALGHALWKSLTHCCYLNINIRARDDPEFHQFLSDLRENNTSLPNWMAKLRERLILNQPLDSLQPFLDAYVITLYHKEINALTSAAISSLTRSKVTYNLRAVDTVANAHKSYPVPSIVENLLLSLPPKETGMSYTMLTLYLGMPVMLTDNMATSHGLTNGSFGHVRYISTRSGTVHQLTKDMFVVVQFKDYTGPGHEEFPQDCIPIFPLRKSFKFSPPVKGMAPLNISRLQFPLLPAFALTDYKVQGGTLNKGMLLFPEKMNQHNAQSLYVMFSRFRSFKDFLILNRDIPDSLLKFVWPKSIVSQEIELREMANKF